MPKKARKRQYAPETRSRFAIEALDEVEVVGPNGSTTILDTNAMLAELERQGKSQNTAVLTGRHGGHKGRISGSEPNFAYEAHKMNNQFYGGKFTVIDIGELLKKPYQTAVNEMASKIQGKSTIFKDWCGARKAQTMSQSRYFRCRLNQVFSDALRKNKSQQPMFSDWVIQKKPKPSRINLPRSTQRPNKIYKGGKFSKPTNGAMSFDQIFNQETSCFKASKAFFEKNCKNAKPVGNLPRGIRSQASWRQSAIDHLKRGDKRCAKVGFQIVEKNTGQCLGDHHVNFYTKDGRVFSAQAFEGSNLTMADWAKETKGNPMPSRFFDFTLQQAMEGEQSGLNRLFGEKSSNWANKMVVIKEMTLGDMA